MDVLIQASPALRIVEVDKSQITILVADPQPLVGQSLAGALEDYPDLEAVEALPASGLDALDAALSHRPGILLIDYWMPDMEGPAVIRLVRAKYPELKSVVLSWFHSPLEVQKAFDAGAGAFVSKSAGVDDLYAAAVAVAREEPQVVIGQGRDVSEWIKQRPDPDKKLWERLKDLSRRQIEIINMISLDLSPKQIGKGLAISPETVKVHVRNILAKTGAGSQKEVVALARSAGLIRN